MIDVIDYPYPSIFCLTTSYDILRPFDYIRIFKTQEND